MPISGKTGTRTKEFSVHRGPTGPELNVHSVAMLKLLFRTHAPQRYKPLVALLRSSLRHCVMIIADGDEWRRTHEAITPELLARVVDTQYAPIVTSVADQAFTRLAGRSANPECTLGVSASFTEIEVEPLMRSVTSSILGHLLFGRPLSPDEAGYLERTLSIATQSLPEGLFGRFNRVMGATFKALNAAHRHPIVLPRAQRKAVRELLRWVDAKVEEAESIPTPPPLLERLKIRYVACRPAELRRRIVAEYMMLFIAGIETTASALTYAIAEIAANPPVREEVLREVRSPSSDIPAARPLTIRLPYLNALFREVLRRHTIVPTMLREAEADYELTGTDHATGTSKVVPISRGCPIRHLPVQGHMRRSVWPDPHTFNPSRFAQPLTSEQTEHYMPFGFGPQRCPGHALARTETILILQSFFQHFDVETKPLPRNIPSERNAVFTNRPLGITVRISPV